MAALYHNPRLCALPCELMRGCLFAENFTTATRVADGFGSISGSGQTIDHGYACTGASRISYAGQTKIGESDYVSVVLRFKTSTAQSGNVLLFSTASYLLMSDIAVAGIVIWVDATGIKANHSDGVSVPTKCSVALDYADDEEHTVTYLIDMVSGSHSLYVDALAVNTQTTSIDALLNGSAATIYLTSNGGLAGATQFTGTLYKLRIFEQLLVEAEHDLYHADTLTSFLDNPLAVWRCDAFGDDTDSNTIHDRTTNHNDLYKGDRSTAAGFPTFDVDKYLFDLVDDFVSNLVTLPSSYTISAVSSTPQVPYPATQQHNDQTFLLPLTQAGAYWGYLHSLIVHNKALTQIEKYHDEYQLQYWQWRGRMWGAYTRLHTEDVCVFAEFMDAAEYVYKDFVSLANGEAYLVTRGEDDGCTFASADGSIDFAHDASHNAEQGTIVIFGDFSGAFQNETWVDKGANYKLSCTSGGNLTFNGQTYALASWDNNEHLAVTFKDGKKAQFFIDGKYLGDTGSTCTVDDTATEVLTIGNNNEHTDNSERALMQVAIFNRVLIEREIKALYESAKYIRSVPMETGNRTAVVEQFAGAVSKTIDPGAPFQLIEVKFFFSAAPTTSENIVISSVYGGVTYQEHSYDPSTTTDTTAVFRFDKRFANNTTITIAYTNTDAATIDVLTIYQNDDSVN